MAYEEYTECVNPEDYGGPPGGDAAAAAIFFSTLYVSLTTLLSQTSSWTVAVIAILIGILSGLISYCQWWLYGRLICLGGERCVVGLLVSVEPPDSKSIEEKLDTDYNINLLLAPHQFGDDHATIESDGFQGEVIKEQDPTKDLGIKFTGYPAPDSGLPHLDTGQLHCEFEGAGIYDFYIACLVALGLAIAAGVAEIICLLGIPIVSWIACIVAIILTIVSFATALIGIGIGVSDQAAVPPEVGSLRPEKDIILIKGEWVFDATHDGWNEIHPVRHGQYIGDWTGAWPDDIRTKIESWCGAVGTAGSPLTGANQAKAENQWRIHPLVDGCRPKEGPVEPPK
jgi:hypothetical protein